MQTKNLIKLIETKLLFSIDMEPLKDKNVTFGASVKIYFAEDCSHEI